MSCQVAEDEGGIVTNPAAEKMDANQVARKANTASPSQLRAAASEVVDTVTETGPDLAASLAPISVDTVAAEGGLKRWATAAVENFKTYKRRKKTTTAEGGCSCSAACGRVGGEARSQWMERLA